MGWAVEKGVWTERASGPDWTGIKQLRVKGKRAIAHSVYGKVVGWNIVQSPRAITVFVIAPRKAAKTFPPFQTLFRQKNEGHLVGRR